MVLAAVSGGVGLSAVMIAFFGTDGCLIGCIGRGSVYVWPFVAVGVAACTAGLTSLIWTFTGWTDHRLTKAAGAAFVACALLVVWLFRF